MGKRYAVCGGCGKRGVHAVWFEKPPGNDPVNDFGIVGVVCRYCGATSGPMYDLWGPWSVSDEEISETAASFSNIGNSEEASEHYGRLRRRRNLDALKSALREIDVSMREREVEELLDEIVARWGTND